MNLIFKQQQTHNKQSVLTGAQLALPRNVVDMGTVRQKSMWNKHKHTEYVGLLF